MKKILLPAMFAIALAGSAFTRSSSTHATAKKMLAGYYNNTLTGDCDTWLFDDPNCSSYPDNYLCYEYVVGWQIMFQWEIGNSCFQPYYSPICNAPGYCFQ